MFLYPSFPLVGNHRRIYPFSERQRLSFIRFALTLTNTKLSSQDSGQAGMTKGYLFFHSEKPASGSVRTHVKRVKLPAGFSDLTKGQSLIALLG